MTLRERPGIDSASAQPARSHAPLSAPLSPVTFAASSDSSFWERWYAQASSEQRQQVIDLAGQQGVLCSAQLPSTESVARRSPLADLLASATPSEQLEPLEAVPLEAIDSDLDETQRLAVARALATPDVALVQGLAGSGKTRVVAELLRQADRLGQRVLFVAPTAAALDSALERLAGGPSARVLRCTSN